MLPPEDDPGTWIIAFAVALLVAIWLVLTLNAAHGLKL